VRKRVAHVFDSGTVATVTRNLRSAKRAAIAVAGLLFVGAAGYGVTVDHETQRSLAAIDIQPAETIDEGAVTIAANSDAPPAEDLSTYYPVPTKNGTSLDEKFPSLAGWVHPVVGSELHLSTADTGLYGAERNGVMRHECGRGHCGVDIAGPIGRPIVAVTAGTVVHIERSRNGKDGRSGRYVRIEHPDGVMTSYMHLSSIRPGLDVGMHVNAGDQIGALGNSGIKESSPHLHFALELPNVPGTHGDHVNTRYTNPAPFLVRAQITEQVDRAHPAKPSF